MIHGLNNLHARLRQGKGAQERKGKKQCKELFHEGSASFQMVSV